MNCVLVINVMRLKKLFVIGSRESINSVGSVIG